MRVAVINYGMGNLASVRRALEECGADALVADDPGCLKEADRIVLPGVGAFGDGMSNLAAGGWIGPLRSALENPGVALLGICLGMQLLAGKGFEGGENAGLGLIPGQVKRLQPASPAERIPHVGWNTVVPSKSDFIFDGIKSGSDFYFVHSYHFETAAPGPVLAMTPYCGSFVSVIRSGNVFGAQFHPEKSSRAGLRFLRNFLAFDPDA